MENIDEKIKGILWPPPYPRWPEPKYVTVDNGIGKQSRVFAMPFHTLALAIQALIAEREQAIREDERKKVYAEQEAPLNLTTGTGEKTKPVIVKTLPSTKGTMPELKPDPDTVALEQSIRKATLEEFNNSICKHCKTPFHACMKRKGLCPDCRKEERRIEVHNSKVKHGYFKTERLYKALAAIDAEQETKGEETDD